jgi:tetraacyldisaccharide 4'-kinase
VSRVFGAAVALRSRRYDAGVLGVRRLDHPVISVGNLTAGGTGKTPLVIELASRLGEAGHRPVILSRGYRRQSRGVVVVSRGKGPEVDWTVSGDEPQLISIRLPHVAVVVGKNRYDAGRRAEQEALGDLFLLDDGFQHRQLHRDVDLVAIDPAEWAGPDTLLPTGRWREPRGAIRRAHAACVQGGEIDAPIPVFDVETVVDGFVREGQLYPVDHLAGRRVTAFAGIAKPERFFRTLGRLGVEVVDRQAFPDHHRFGKEDLERVGGEVQVTTEKDAVRLGSGSYYFLKISANIRQFNELHALIRERLARRT